MIDKDDKNITLQASKQVRYAKNYLILSAIIPARSVSRPN